MKKNITISIDVDLYAEAKSRNLMFSKVFNNYLKSYLNIERKEVEEDNLEAELIHAKTKVLELEDKKKEIQKKAQKIIDESRPPPPYIP